MADPTPSEQRRRWINIGEIVAVAGLLLSGLALWNSWGRDDRPAPVIEKVRAIPLALRGSVDDGGKVIRLAPVEPGHALESLTVTAVAPAKGSAPFGGDPMVSAALIETWLARDSDQKAPGVMTVTVEARYIEEGETRRVSQRYRIAYRWVDGGLFAGRSLRLTGITRA